MTDREHEAIRALLTIMRRDMSTIAKVLAAMVELGFTADEVQEAVNQVAMHCGEPWHD